MLIFKLKADALYYFAIHGEEKGGERMKTDV